MLAARSEQIGYQASQVASQLRNAMTAGVRLYAWTARRGGTAGLISAGWDPDDAASLVFWASAFRQLAAVYNGQVPLPAAHDFAADLADLADLSGPG